MNTRKGRIAIIAGRDPLIRDDTDGGSVFLEYLTKQLSESLEIVDVFIPLGVAGGKYNEARAVAQKEHVVQAKESVVSLHYVPVAQGTLEHIDTSADYFHARINRSEIFANSFETNWFQKYDLVYVLHVANAFSLVERGLLPLDRTVLFPMMTSAHYRDFSSVPKEYIQKEANTLQAIRHICCPSDDEIERLIEGFSLDSKKFFKIHRGFDDTDFPSFLHTRKEKDPLSISLICANGIRPQKDHLFLIPVVQELLTYGVTVTVHLTGNNGRSHNPVYNSYTDLFWETVTKQGVADNFIAHDILPREELVSLMGSCDVAVYPSKVETFGKSVLESVVSGLPTIVCDDVPAFREFIQNRITGLISPRIASNFAADIFELISNPQLYEEVSRNGISLRPAFTWKKVLDDFKQTQIERGLITAY